ncbi:MAG: DUF91 domain-containing protein [Acidobacteria bacterium]|nr:DUF91 domain-containing protein [Acidobacteriota bacterium]
MQNPSYFLVSVSTAENLELCKKYALAGFPSGASGVWTFCEIQDGDFLSFLYGARAYNLYRVSKREAIRDADKLPPWKPLTFKESGKTYFFPFRLQLQPVRIFAEPLVRAEFSYVAENLLLRGGYRKTHFQADQTTLQSVSQMGTLSEGRPEPLSLPDYATFNPSFTRNTKLLRSPEVSRFQETILQSAIRRHLSEEVTLASFLRRLNLSTPPAAALEILGEKALPQGHIDLLLKQRVPLGTALNIPIEVKLNRAQAKDVSQVCAYMSELGEECPVGILVAAEFSKKAVRLAKEKGIRLVKYAVSLDLREPVGFAEIHRALMFEPVEN